MHTREEDCLIVLWLWRDSMTKVTFVKKSI